MVFDATESRYLFSKNLERLNLAFPLFFLLLTAGELITTYQLKPIEQNISFFLAKIIFLNHIHVHFTLLLIFFCPEMRFWVKEQQQNSHFFLARWTFVFAGVFSILLFIIPYLQKHHSYLKFDLILITWLAVTGFHHNFSQAMGLSLAYNRKSGQTQNSYEQYERTLCKILVISQCAYLFARQFEITTTGLILNFLMFGSAIGLLIIAALLPIKEYRHKKIFMLRYALYPFVPFSTMAFVGMLSIHGIEYFCVFYEMQSRSLEKSKYNLRKTLALMFLFTAGLTIFSLPNQKTLGWLLNPHLTEYSVLISYLTAFAGAFTYLHYHIDSQMFRMRNPATKRVLNELWLEK